MAQVPVTDNFKVLPDTGLGVRWTESVKPTDISKNAQNLITGLGAYARGLEQQEEDHLKDIANQVMDYRSQALQQYKQNRNERALKDDLGNNMLGNLYQDEGQFVNGLFEENGLSASQRHRVNDLLTASTRSFRLESQAHYDAQYQSNRQIVYDQSMANYGNLFVTNYSGQNGANIDEANKSLQDAENTSYQYYREYMGENEARYAAKVQMSGMIAGAIQNMIENDPMRAERMRRDYADYLSPENKLTVDARVSAAVNAERGNELGKLMLTGGTYTVDGSFESNPNATLKNAPPGMVRAAQVASRETGVPIEYILTQFYVETSDGKGGWSKRAQYNNFGAVKGKGGYTSTTQEVRGGKTVKESAQWAGYASPEAFGHYYANLIKNKRYRNALKETRNAKGFFDTIQKAGYATDPNYGTKMANTLKRLFPNGKAGISAAQTITVPAFQNVTQALTWLDDQVAKGVISQSEKRAAVERFQMAYRAQEEEKQAQHIALMDKYNEEEKRLSLENIKLTRDQLKNRTGLNNLDKVDQACFDYAKNPNVDPNEKYRWQMKYLEDDEFLLKTTQMRVLAITGGDKALAQRYLERQAYMKSPDRRSAAYTFDKSIQAQFARALGYKSVSAMMNDEVGYRQYRLGMIYYDKQVPKDKSWGKNGGLTRAELNWYIQNAIIAAQNEEDYSRK